MEVDMNRCFLIALVVLASAGGGRSALAQTGTKPAITALAATPDGKGTLSGSQAGVAYRSADGKEDGSLPVQLDHVLALACAPDGLRLAVGGGSPAEVGAVEIWSWAERKRLGRLDAHVDIVTSVAWLPEGKIATGSADRTVRVWDSVTFRA